MAGLRYIDAPEEFDEWDFIHGLLLRCFEPMAGRIDPPSSLHGMGPRDLAAQAQRGKAVIAIAEGPVGCVFLEPRAPRVQVRKLAVDPSFRWRGITRQMLGLADVYARQLGCEGLELQTRVELTENHAAFRRLGFREVARTAHPGHARPTSVTFRRDLPT